MTRSLTHYKSRNAVQHGQALVPVILVVLILTTMAIAFTTSSNRELKAAANFNSDAVRSNAARGAVNYAMSALGQISNNGWTYGIVPPGPDTDANGWMQIGDAWVKIDVTDTAACININNASATTLERMTEFAQNPQIADAIVDWRTPETTATSDGAKSDYYQGLSPAYNCKDAPYDTIEELLLVKGVTPTILYGSAAGTPISADDAQNNNQNSTTNGNYGTGGNGTSRQAAARPGGATGAGAGAGTGTGAKPGTGTGNGTGMTGAGTGAAAAATAGDTNWDDIYSTSTIPLAELFTTMSMERNIAADGTARVNINTASATALQGLGISSNLANALIRARTPATTGGGGAVGTGSTNTARPGTGATPAMPPAAAPARPNARQAAARPGGGAGTGGGTGAGAGTGPKPGTGTGAGAGAGAGAAATPVFKTIADLLTVPGFSQTIMQQIADKVSVDDNQYHANLVNINTAPSEVLATVPGMDHTTLNAIIAYRQGGQSFQTMGDFFALQGITRQEFQNVMASLTAKSSIYRVRIKVRTPGQQSIYAVTAYVQMTDNGPTILSWRETPRTPGWAYWVPSPVLPTPTVGTTGATPGQ